jgi:uncharacterized protein YqgC (DUF456 family)
MKTSQELNEKKKGTMRPSFIAMVLVAELVSNASLYFALKSGNKIVTAFLVGLIVLGCLGLVWHK